MRDHEARGFEKEDVGQSSLQSRCISSDILQGICIHEVPEILNTEEENRSSAAHDVNVGHAVRHLVGKEVDMGREGMMGCGMCLLLFYISVL